MVEGTRQRADRFRHRAFTRSSYRSGVLRRSLVALALLVPLVGCSSGGRDATDSATGNMAVGSPVSAPGTTRWFTGQLVVEPADAGHACLLLATPAGRYVLRSADPHLEAVAWQQDGDFDATHSGIARDGRLVAAYADEATSVRGAVSATADVDCGDYPTLAFLRAARPTPVAPHAPGTAAAEPEPGDQATPAGADPLEYPVEKSGRLTAVRGNQGEGWCLALATDAGLYTVSEATADYDAVVTVRNGRIDERRTGLHVHGRNSLGMAATVGQRVELRGTLSTETDVQCSRYYDLRVTALR
jgi:hypothetical protein